MESARRLGAKHTLHLPPQRGPAFAAEQTPVGRVRGQEVEHEALVPPAEVPPHGLTRLTAGSVTDDMAFAVAQPAPPPRPQVPNQERGPPAFLGPTSGADYRPRPPVQRPREIALLAGPGRHGFGLAPAPPPHRPALRIGIAIPLILNHGHPVSRRGGQELA
jgi:hypothetical protein